MHGGDPFNPDTAAGRVFRYLYGWYTGLLKPTNPFEPSEEWVDAWVISQLARVTALSTRISEIRHFLAAHPDRELAVEHREVTGRKHQYRIVRSLERPRIGKCTLAPKIERHLTSDVENYPRPDDEGAL